MNLTEDQKNAVSSWIAGGAQIAEVQKRLAAEFDVHMTYMDVRFLVDDLRLTLKDVERAAPAGAVLGQGSTGGPAAGPAGTRHDQAQTASVPPQGPMGGPASPAAPDEAESLGEPGPGSVSVRVDQVTRPGTLASGSVKFSDGQTATWYLDQYGRLGMAAAQKGYRPHPKDLEDFQIALEQELAKLGM